MPTEPSSTDLPRPIGRLLDPAELKALSRRSTARGAAQLALHLAMLAASAALVAWSRGAPALLVPALLVPAMVLHGWLLLALFAPLHETAHYTAFVARPLNLTVGWLCGLPALFNWHYYQLFHFAHHRHTQDPARDPELDPPAPRDRLDYLLRLTGWHTWKGRVRVMARLALGRAETFAFIPEAARARVVASARLQLAATLLFVAIAVAAGRGVDLLVFWIGPVLLAMPLLRAYLLVEHTGCSEDDDGLANTRTTLTAAFVRASMWNMPFHAEHHLFPSIPFHALPAVHARIAPHLRHVAPGYVRATASILGALPRSR
ncbi:MAG: fatty acid desaturase [Alphaproteobacteria bacterium]|nr:fatty acid desaturase [Alphaproteobacteria bacterium]